MEISMRELEAASRSLMASPNVVTSEQRSAAENVFLAFRKSPMPYNLCRYLFENSKVDYVLFQAASTLKESVVREWALLKAEEITALRVFLLSYVTHNIHSQRYVREQVLQALAVIVKRGSLDGLSGDKEAIFSDVATLIRSGQSTMQIVACSMLTALLDEFSSTNRSSNVGLSWELHCKCKQAFEDNDLQRVFGFCLHVLRELESSSTPLSAETAALFGRVLAIIQQVFSWDFIPKHIPRRLIGTFMTSHNVSFKPPRKWKSMVLDKSLIEMMYRVHVCVRHDPDMAHHSMQCLAQLASLNGPVLANDQDKLDFLTNFIQHFLHFINSYQLLDHESLGIANVVNSLVIFFSVSSFLELPADLFSSFLALLTDLTTSFCRAAALEEALHRDDMVHTEALEKSLDAWMCFVSTSSCVPDKLLNQHATQVFNVYLQNHLAAPDGTRNQTEVGASAADEEEYEEDEEDDRSKFQEALMAIGALGRQVPEHSVPLLVRLLEGRVCRMHSHLQRIQQHSDVNSSLIGQPDEILTSIYEDLHWLLLISGHVLTEESAGETPMIPEPIMQYSISQSQSIDIDTTLKVLASPSSGPADTPGGDHASDMVVRLVSAVLRLCEVERRAIEAHLDLHLSPQLSRTSMWFLSKWLRAYLLPNETYYSQMSLALTAAFGGDTEGGQWTVAYLVDKVVSNLSAWSSECEVIEDSLNVLVALTERKDRCSHVMKCSSFLSLAADFSRDHQRFSSLSLSAKRHLCQALVLACSATFQSEERKQEYWQTKFEISRTEHGEVHFSLRGRSTNESAMNFDLVSLDREPSVALCYEVLQSLVVRLHGLFTPTQQQEQLHWTAVKPQVLSILQCMCGVAQATNPENVNALFLFLHPVLQESVKLLDVYHNHADVVDSIVELFSVVANSMICYLLQSDSRRLYECCLRLIQTYAKYHTGGGRVVSSEVEEEQYSDVLTLIDMLTNILSKDFIDFNINEEGSTEEVTVCPADVVLYGLDIIVPIMTPELLKFPALCTDYVRLITYLAEIYPDRVCQLPEKLLHNLMAAVEFGLKNASSDIVKLCLEFVGYIGGQVYKGQLSGSVPHQAMAHFLKVVFHMLLLETFDMDLLDSASTTLFSLMCCHQAVYNELVTELLSLQTEPTLHKRLHDAFHSLTPPNQPLTDSRQNRIAFRDRFERFLIDVRGFLCVK